MARSLEPVEDGSPDGSEPLVGEPLGGDVVGQADGGPAGVLRGGLSGVAHHRNLQSLAVCVAGHGPEGRPEGGEGSALAKVSERSVPPVRRDLEGRRRASSLRREREADSIHLARPA